MRPAAGGLTCPRQDGLGSPFHTRPRGRGPLGWGLVWLALALCLGCVATVSEPAERPPPATATVDPREATATAGAVEQSRLFNARLGTAIALEGRGQLDEALGEARAARAFATAVPTYVRAADDFLTRAPLRATAEVESLARLQALVAAATATPPPVDFAALRAYEEYMQPRWNLLRQRTSAAQTLSAQLASNPAALEDSAWRESAQSAAAAARTTASDVEQYAPVPPPLATIHARMVSTSIAIATAAADYLQGVERRDPTLVAQAATRLGREAIALESLREQYNSTVRDLIGARCC